MEGCTKSGGLRFCTDQNGKGMDSDGFLLPAIIREREPHCQYYFCFMDFLCTKLLCYGNHREQWIQMVKLSSGQYVIGFDNGYQFGKTAQSLFDNGVYAMGTVEPTVKEHSSLPVVMNVPKKLTSIPNL